MNFIVKELYAVRRTVHTWPCHLQVPAKCMCMWGTVSLFRPPIKTLSAPCLGRLVALTVGPSALAWSQLCCSGRLGPPPQRSEGHWSSPGETWGHAEQRNINNQRGATLEDVYVCVSVRTEGGFHLQTPRCGVSNGRSHSSTSRSLQSAVPEGERGIMGSSWVCVGNTYLLSCWGKDEKIDSRVRILEHILSNYFLRFN